MSHGATTSQANANTLSLPVASSCGGCANCDCKNNPGHSSPSSLAGGTADSTPTHRHVPGIHEQSTIASQDSAPQRAKGASSSTFENASSPLLNAPEHVLSTLEHDGSRRWMYPKLSTGYWWHRRKWVGYGLIAFFVLLPHFRIAGKPPILIDILRREFTFLGHTFLSSDTYLLALGMLTVFLSIVILTAITGRVWCGWGCPQTVYMEFVFRPIDRLFQGTTGKGGRPRKDRPAWMAVARIAVYFVICTALAHTFLSYFVGTDRLANWLLGSPFQHPVAFLVMAITTIAMLFDFLYFREQTCLIACPYGRLQSVMLDRNSLIVAYDERRGEPRHKGKNVTENRVGDCVDCKRCQVVCPTGIDIRNGLQMECINCTQCIDACDDVMRRTGKAEGLIRYTSQDALEGKPNRILRPRTIAYPAVLCVVIALFAFVLSTKYGFDTQLLREPGNSFNLTGDGEIANRFKLRLTNRTNEPRSYAIEISDIANAEVFSVNDETITLDAGQSELIPIRIEVPLTAVPSSGRREFKISISDDVQNQRTVKGQLMGPRK